MELISSDPVRWRFEVRWNGIVYTLVYLANIRKWEVFPYDLSQGQLNALIAFVKASL